ncbi:hypothetical protein JR316_0001904 [Psilocybe cubensis]|nr:hypothetical protein JR316_0001904 [Psilocybe cubensis]KAH9485000.1 hypothetical protein JR316_0001904 [Psilocybe cubensis]
MTHFYERLEEEVGKIIDQLMEEFQEPLPEDETERYKRRKAVVERGLDLTEGCLVVVYGELGISEVEARERFGHIKPKFERVLLIIVNIIDHHPRIVRTILFAVATWILPIRVVRIILRAFGLGPAIRGRRIATRWLQKFLFDEVMEAEIWMKMLWAAKGKARWSIKIILAAVLRFVKDLGFRVLEALLNNDNVAL